MTTLLIDFDNVLNNLTEAWVMELNSKFGTTVRPEDIVSWNISQFFDLTKAEVVSPLFDDDFWRDKVSVNPDSKFYLNKLHEENYNIYLVTATDYRNMEIKMKYLIEPYFAFLDPQHIIITHNKNMIQGDLIVDDHIDNLLNNNRPGILFTGYHNKAIDVTEYSGIYRANNWAECYDLIHKLT